VGYELISLARGRKNLPHPKEPEVSGKIEERGK
jgi:hypothetical protein